MAVPRSWRRWLAGLAVLALLVYGGMIAYLVIAQDALIFKPPARAPLHASSLGLDPQRVLLNGREALSTIAWRIDAPGGTPSPYWIVYLHGNDATISSGGNVTRYHQLRSLGVNLLAPEYPGFGDVGGRPSERGLQAAARAAYDYLRRTLGLEGARIAIYGWSLGSGGAIPLARDVDEAALIVEGAFTSVLRRAQAAYPFLPISRMVRHPFHSEDAVDAVGSPILLLHSPEDAIIPFEDGRRLYDRARPPKRLVELTGGHVFPNLDDADRYLTAVHAFLTGEAGWTLEPPRRSVGVALRRELDARGLDAAIAAYHRWRAEGPSRWNLSEYELDYVGWRLRKDKAFDAAIAILRLNAEQFPDSPLAWAALGAALADADRAGDARQALSRSIRLDPSAANPSHRTLARVP